MLAEEREEIVALDPAVASRSPVRWKQILIDPVDHRPRVYVEQAAHFMCRVDRFRFGVCYRRRQIPYLYHVWVVKPAVVEFP